jgi:hypothetical protein
MVVVVLLREVGRGIRASPLRIVTQIPISFLGFKAYFGQFTSPKFVSVQL